MIRLFDANSVVFTTNGLGPLIDVISCVIKEERNGGFELEMVYPIHGKRYDDIFLRQIIVAKPNPYSDPQAFRIYRITRPIHGRVTINAEHISYDLSGYPVSPFTASSITSALVNMKSASVTPCPFTFTTDKVIASPMTVTAPASIRSLLGGVEGSLLELYSGEYEFNNYDIKLWTNRGANRGVSIRYGKNLTDLSQEENCSNVYTGVYPFWYSEEEGLMQLTNKVVAAEGTYGFVHICPLDLSQEWYTKPTESELLTRAQKYMKDNNIGIPKVSLTVSFVTLAQSEEYKNFALLETVRLCDTVNVEFPELKVSATTKCISTTFDAVTEKYITMELGDAKSNLSSTLSEQNTVISKTPSKTYLEKAIENATNLISGAAGGYVILHSSTGGSHPDEILVMDTDDIYTATNVWRWNKGGLGHSKTGYNGPYDTAITQDGEIVAEFITSGELNGAIIKAGTIQAESLEIGTEIIDSIDQTKVNTTSISNLDGKISQKVSSSQLQPNLLKNTSFLDGFNGWTTYGDNVYIASNGRNGVNAIGVKASGLTGDKSWGVRQLYPATQGVTYSFSCEYQYRDVSLFDSKIQMGIIGRSATGVYIPISNTFYSVTDTAKQWQWQRCEHTVTITDTNIVNIEVVLRVNRNGWIWYREPMLVLSDTPSAVYSPSLPAMESIIIQQAGLISSKVSQGEYNTYKTQTADQIALKVSQKDYNAFGGGENLAYNSSFREGTIGWNLASGVVRRTDYMYNGFPTIYVNQQGSSVNTWAGAKQNNNYAIPCEAGEIFTASAYLYTSNVTSIDERAVVNLHFVNDANAIVQQATTNVELVNGKWIRGVVTANVPNGATKVRMNMFVAKNGAVFYACPKLERGTIATDYSSNTNNLESAIVLNAKDFTAAFKTVGVDGYTRTGKTVINTNGLTVYDGGLTIKNKAGANVFEADTNGDLKLKNVTAENGTFTGTAMSSTTTIANGFPYIKTSTLAAGRVYASGTHYNVGGRTVNGTVEMDGSDGFPQIKFYDVLSPAHMSTPHKANIRYNPLNSTLVIDTTWAIAINSENININSRPALSGNVLFSGSALGTVTLSENPNNYDILMFKVNVDAVGHKTAFAMTGSSSYSLNFANLADGVGVASQYFLIGELNYTVSGKTLTMATNRTIANSGSTWGPSASSFPPPISLLQVIGIKLN